MTANTVKWKLVESFSILLRSTKVTKVLESVKTHQNLLSNLPMLYVYRAIIRRKLRVRNQGVGQAWIKPTKNTAKVWNLAKSWMPHIPNNRRIYTLPM